ncbi:AtpZ/AtpI family protein [Arcticibacter sp. MXS-1]|uniref:AtpZ/AtpI family protein n=1 Tax=Arcticibacter sp. MXS-1 TaxID=3341726 RepID=UPI0035A99C73
MPERERSDKDQKIEEGKRVLNSYAYYTGLGFQMIAVIGVFAFIGHKIDESQASKTPLYTAFFSLAGVFASLYLVIRSVKKNKS